MPADDALRALTVFPARLFGVDHKLGTLDQGKLAHLFVTDGDLFGDKTKIIETWVAGHREQAAAEAEFELTGQWQINAADPFGRVELEISGKPASLQARWIWQDPDAEETKLANVQLKSRHLTATFDGKPFEQHGVFRLSAVVIPDKVGMTWVFMFSQPWKNVHPGPAMSCPFS